MIITLLTLAIASAMLIFLLPIPLAIEQPSILGGVPRRGGGPPAGNPRCLFAIFKLWSRTGRGQVPGLAGLTHLRHAKRKRTRCAICSNYLRNTGFHALLLGKRPKLPSRELRKCTLHYPQPLTKLMNHGRLAATRRAIPTGHPHTLGVTWEAQSAIH
jgi:hypothetical protein